MFALIGGDVRHGGGAGDGDLPFPVLRPSQRGVLRLAASGRFRAVVAGLSGRVALPAAYARRPPRPASRSCCGRRSGRTRAPPPHALSYLPLRHIYRHADAIATYGPHVSAYVRAKGARGPVFEAPQSVDDAFWSAAATPGSAMRRSRRCLPADWRGKRGSRCSFGPGVPQACQHQQPRWFWSAAVRSEPGPPPPARPCSQGRPTRRQLRNFYAGSDVVVIPSIPTRDFREPWGLVANEAFNQGVPVIATDAVGAAAGGLIEHERTGLVVPAGDAGRPRRARCAACTTTPRCAPAWAPPDATRCAPTRTPRGPPGWPRALAAAGAGRPKDGC